MSVILINLAGKMYQVDLTLKLEVDGILHLKIHGHNITLKLILMSHREGGRIFSHTILIQYISFQHYMPLRG